MENGFEIWNIVTNFASKEVLVTLACFAILKFNDLRHLEKNFKEFKEDTKEQFDKFLSAQTKQSTKINRMDKNIAVLKTKTETLEKSVKNK